MGADGVRDGRGVAVADLDGDGRRDLVVANNHAAPTFYLNRASAGRWLEVELVGRDSARDAVGARLRLTLSGPEGQRVLSRFVEAGAGYAAQSAFPVHFGLGDSATPTALEVRWPSGRVEQFGPDQLGIDRRLRIEEGQG